MISKVRLGTISGGLAVAVAVLVLLGLAGVLADRSRPARLPANPVAETGPQTAVQPELERALLAHDDLAGAMPVMPRRSATPPVRRPVEVWLNAGCTQLFERLGEVAGAVTRESTGPRGAQLRQALAVLPSPAEAGAVHRHHRTTAARCRPFAATLDDGTAVTVEATPATLNSPLLPIDAEISALQLRVTTPGGVLEGYLTLARVGRVVSVLRLLGPPGVVTLGSAGTTLGRALDKLAALAVLESR